eukprot:CAMPEP_0116547282 /NCGR_PEP_ID=MMETSP0397-20121206/3692_1 /TAXON_ID=216820 /ORGANISM="Cyclophora tenuis, Strain ECT3854" /LENGTH=117 /DNA_ID=CAMNT_0004071799 /DNA_START=85 /DNA_END=439 /DNA_ORIENTATION=+
MSFFLMGPALTARQAFDEYYPGYPYVNPHDGIYYTFTALDAQVIVLDTDPNAAGLDTDTADKTCLGLPNVLSEKHRNNGSRTNSYDGNSSSRPFQPTHKPVYGTSTIGYPFKPKPTN